MNNRNIILFILGFILINLYPLYLFSGISNYSYSSYFTRDNYLFKSKLSSLSSLSFSSDLLNQKRENLNLCILGYDKIWNVLEKYVKSNSVQIIVPAGSNYKPQPADRPQPPQSKAQEYTQVESLFPISLIAHPGNTTLHEAAAFLDYIITEYDKGLPEIMIFLHGPKYSWHHSGSIEELIYYALYLVSTPSVNFGTNINSNINNKLSRDFTFSPESLDVYLNLNDMWFTDMCKINPGPLENNKMHMYIWKKVLEPYGLKRPYCVSTICCSQFLLSKNKIYHFPKQFYINLLDALLTIPPEFININSDHIPQWGGFFMEHTWHVIFGQDSQMPEFPTYFFYPYVL